MIQRMGRILRRKPLAAAAFVIIFAADTLEDPRFSEDRDGFLEEIEEIAESSRIFKPSEFDHLATFLDYSGPRCSHSPRRSGRSSRRIWPRRRSRSGRRRPSRTPR